MIGTPALVRAACDLRDESDALTLSAGELTRRYSGRGAEVTERALCETLANAAAMLAHAREHIEHALVAALVRYENHNARRARKE